MLNKPGGLSYLAQLRQDAESRLRDGSAPGSHGGFIRHDALLLLYQLASKSETSGDALKLLHELQAHQVEIDMQHAQLESSEQATGDELTRYRALFEQAPVAYFVLGTSGQVIEANQSAFALLGLSPEAVEGGPFQEHFFYDDRDRLMALLAQVRAAPGVAPCTLRLRRGAEGAQAVRVLPATAEGGEAILVALVPLDDAPAPV